MEFASNFIERVFKVSSLPSLGIFKEIYFKMNTHAS